MAKASDPPVNGYRNPMRWTLWQLVDSGFPAGGFAHSAGLEAAYQLGEVTQRAELDWFVRAAIVQTGYSSLPLVNSAHQSPERLGELDAYCDAFLSNHVANQASRAQGSAFLSTCARTFPALGELPRLAQDLHRHYAPIFGAVLSTIEVDRESAQQAFLFIAVRGILSAAVRLGLIGPQEAQKVQVRFTPDLERVAARCANLSEADLAQTAPLLDVFHGTHDRLYSRMFQS